MQPKEDHMGCDFFYDGNLPDETLQTKVIDFVSGYFDKIDLAITPDPATRYSTEIFPRKEKHEAYPFNFFGIIPCCKSDYGILEGGQFIFDRNNSSRMVKLMRLPESYGVIPHHYYQCNPKENIDDVLARITYYEELKCPESWHQKFAPYPYQVVVDDGGYSRLGGGLAFALLLTICKLRWWPDLKIGDDYENCDIVDALLDKYGFKLLMLDESLDFGTCYDLFITEYDRDFPPPPAAGSEDAKMAAYARLIRY
jgi:hypothetical protein